MKKIKILLLTSGMLLVTSSLSLLTDSGVIKTSAYTANGELVTTIDLNDTSEANIRSYYSNLNSLNNSELTGNNLLKNLKPILKNNQRYFAYDGSSLWKLYEITDRDWKKSPASAISGYNSSTNKIVGYSYGSTDPYIHALYVNRDVDNKTTAWADHQQTQWGINQEHIWPKSQGFNETGKGGARGDPMHLWAGNGRVNGTEHNNHPYGYVDTSKSYSDPVSAKGFTNLSGNLKGTSKTLGSGTVFEPQDSDKGDIARAIFYMVARYNYLSGSDSDGIDTNNPNLELVETAVEKSSYTSTTTTKGQMGLVQDLLEWNHVDPPDEYEIHRNNLLYNNYTKNRNPFIDFPEWADYIWGDKKGTSYADPNNDSINVFSGATSGTISISQSGLSLDIDETAQISATSSDNSNITWSTSNSSIVTISSSSASSGNNITLTAKSSGSAIITASATINNKVYSKTCSVVVKTESGDAPVSDKGTADNPLTVSEAYDILSTTSSGYKSSTKYYVKGTVTGDVTYNETYHSCTFDITDGVRTINAYSIADASTEPGNDYYVTAGYEVLVGGALINYKGTKYEVGYSSGIPSELVSVTSPKVLTSLSIAGYQTSFEIGSEFSFGGTGIAEYSDGTHKDVTNELTFAGYNMSSLGEQTVTVSYTEDNVTKTADYTIIINEEHGTTPEDPLSVSEALAICERTGSTATSTSYYCQGEIKEISDVSLQYHNASFTITDNNGNDLVVFRSKYLNNTDFTSTDQISIGDEVVVYGKLVNYKETTKEFTTGCYIYEFVNKTSSLTLSPSSITLDLSEQNTVQLSATLDGVQMDDLTLLSWESSNDEVLTVSGMGFVTALGVGEANVIATLKLDGSVEATCSVTVVDNTPISPSGYTFRKITSTSDLKDGTYTIVYENGSLMFNSSLEILDSKNSYQTIDSISTGEVSTFFQEDLSYCFTIKSVTGGYSIKSSSGYFIGRKSDSNGIEVSTTEAYVNEISFSGGNADIHSSGGAYLRFNSSNDEMRFRYYKSATYTSQKAVQLYRVEEEYFADVFLSTVTCDANGVNSPTFGTSSWSNLATKYSGLSDTTKNNLRLAEYDVTGSGSGTIVTAREGTFQIVAEAVAKYDYIVGKYGTSLYTNFMNRSVEESNIFKTIHIDDSGVILIVASISLITMLSFGLMLLKKKHD